MRGFSGKTIAIWALTLALIVGSSFLPRESEAGAVTLTQAELKAQAVERALHAHDQRLALIQGQANSTLVALNALDTQLSTAQEQLSAAETSVAINQHQVATVKSALAVLVQHYQKQQSELGTFLRFNQESGDGGIVAVVLGARSFSDFVSRVFLMGQVAGFENKVLSEMAANRREQHQKELSLIALGQQLQAQEQSAQVAESKVAASATARQTLLYALRSQQTAEQAVIAQLEREKQGLLATIRQLEVEVAQGNLTPGQLQILVDGVAAAYGIDPQLVMDIIHQESGGNPNAKSSAGALGLMQLMPSTASGLGVANALNPKQNVQGGVAYFAGLLKEFHGNLALALAAYNAGPNAVKAYGGIPPYPETQNYVRNILSNYYGQKAKSTTGSVGSSGSAPSAP